MHKNKTRMINVAISFGERTDKNAPPYFLPKVFSGEISGWNSGWVRA
jgi:hypothetical protein